MTSKMKSTFPLKLTTIKSKTKSKKNFLTKMKSTVIIKHQRLKMIRSKSRRRNIK